MKQLLFFLLISATTFSQNFEKVDAIVLQYPRFSKIDDLVQKIENDFSLDADKTRAAFFWLAKNIRYNLAEYYNPKQRSYRFSYSSEEEKEQKLQEIKDKLVATTFKNKTGVCENYAQSLKKICDLLNIQSEVIKGFVRSNSSEIGKVQNSTNHAWNAVKIDEKWIIIDATWAAGSKYNGKWIRDFNDYFFDISKDKIFKTHYPEDALWMLRFGRMSKEEFFNQPIYTNTFLSLNADLISPKNGIISIKSTENIELKFKNLDTNLQIYYTIKGMKYAQKPVIKTENEITSLIIKNPKKNTDLILYINNEDALHFKIKVR